MKKEEKDKQKECVSAEKAANGAEFMAVDKTAGQIIHNEITYRGLDLFANTAFAVGFAYLAARTKAGQQYFTQPMKKFFTGCMELFTKDKEAQKEGAAWGTRFVSIMLGGSVIIPPVMYLEKKSVKKTIVKDIDEAIYGKDEVASNPRFKEAYDSIDHEPVKDFWTGMAARFAILFPMIIGTMTKSINDPAAKYMYEPTAKASKWVAESMGIKPKGHLLEVQKGKQNWEHLHETIGFDLSLTAIYSFLHEYAYKSFAGIKARCIKKAEETAPETQEMTPSAPLPSQETPSSNEQTLPDFASRIEHKPRPAHKHASHVEQLASNTQPMEMAL